MEIVTRVLFPIAACLAVFAAVSSLPATASALTLIGALVVLDVASLIWGRDSRDGADWQDPFGEPDAQEETATPARRKGEAA